MLQAITKRYIQYGCRAELISCIPIFFDIAILLHSVEDFFPDIPHIHLYVFLYHDFLFTLLSAIKEIELDTDFFSLKAIVYLLYLPMNHRVAGRQNVLLVVDPQQSFFFCCFVQLLLRYVLPLRW